MNRSAFKFPSPAEKMLFDGERYTSGVEGPIQREHYHRYLFTLRYCVDKDVLDVASGEGYGSFLIGQAARSVTGVDIDQKAVDFANKNYMSERVSYLRGDAAKLPINDQSVDVVVSFETIEHFNGQEDFIKEIDRVLRPGGLLIMSSPNREIYSEAQDYQNPFHLHEMNKQEFVDLLSKKFPHIRLVEQGAVIGSVIMPLAGGRADDVEGFTTRDGQLFERLIGVPAAPYFIALAAREPVPAPALSILHADFYNEQIQKQFAAIDAHRQEQAAVSLRTELAAQSSAMAARHGEQVEQLKTIMQARHAENMAEAETLLRAELAEQSVQHSEETRAAAQREQAMAGRYDELHDHMVRSLALTRTWHSAKLPRELRGINRLIHKKTRRLARDYRVVASSPLFDRNWYLKTNPDVAERGEDPVLHYLRHGAAEGRQPGPVFNARQYALANPDVVATKSNTLLHFLRFGIHEGRPLRQQPLAVKANEVFFCDPLKKSDSNFDAAFLEPFYAAAGKTGDPSIVWRNLSSRGAIPPTSRDEAEAMASIVRESEFFDASFYALGLPQGMDPALHYVVIGEALEWAPSECFDPRFYLERYPDIRDVSPLAHFQNYGKIEGRIGVSVAQSLKFEPLNDERRPVLVICHEASRTGAPILGWNLIRDLRKKHPVITFLMRGGVLEKDFGAESDVVVGPMGDAAWDPIEIMLVAERLVKTYRPLYAVANSIVTSPIVPQLAAFGVPSIALVHEFASYTRPLEWMRPVFDWATHIVFPAKIVADSSFESFPALEQRRGIHILAQGRQLLPSADHADSARKETDIGTIMRSSGEKHKFIVLGAGLVHIRKGVDLFLSVAAAARRLAPDVPFKFIWVGEGYKPEEDASYSVYLCEQINKSGLQDKVVFLEPVTDFESAYRTADVFLMSSRLDPQPNVGIDAVTLGLPIVCFEGACGTGEVLARDPETRSLVVPHLDVEAAAREICRLAKDPDLRKSIGAAVERVGRDAYNGENYAAQIDAWGCESAAALLRSDLDTLRCSGAIEPELALPPQSNLPKWASLEQIVLFQSAVVGASPNQHRNAYFRRAVPGFHPQAYAVAHHECGQGGENPTAHWLRHGRPGGGWSHPVFSPSKLPTVPHKALRVALHAHFYYPDLATELAERLKTNRTQCDLFVSTDTEAKAETLRRHLAKHDGLLKVLVMPNLGRDIGPMLTGFREEIASGGYDLWGHVHGKKSAWSEAGIGDAFRTFLWDNLIGGEYPMLDIAVDAFASDPKLGLVFAEDPHLVGWDGNRKNAEALAERMGLSRELPEFFDFPLGTMFWFRPLALHRLFALGLKWDDYPKEPLPYDGSLLHALERIVPFVTAAESYGFATLRAPHSTW